MHAIHADETVTEIVEVHPELRPAIGSFEFPCVGSETEIAFDVNCISIAGPVDLSASQSAGHINPIVWPKCGMAHPKLSRVARVKAGEHDLAQICPAKA